jgi:hypothetical protein
VRVVLLVTCAALIAVAAAPVSHAKEFTSISVVGADGRSNNIRASSGTIDGLFGGLIRARPSGGYVRVYPLGPTGHVGIPGRFFPATGAVCLDWNQAAPRRECWRPSRALRPILLRASNLRLFHGAGPTLGRLTSTKVAAPVLTQLRVAFELGFDRWRLARQALRPTRCLQFSGAWRGSRSHARPRQFCLSERGVYASGMLYVLGVEPFRLAWTNPSGD